MDLSPLLQLEALLFTAGEPVDISFLAKKLQTNTTAIQSLIDELVAKYEGTALSILKTETTVSLVTSSLVSEFLSAERKESLSRELTKPALETLAIILYGDYVTRADIDYLRGVNSQFILRSLLTRGLVDRGTHPSDSRKVVYMPSADLLSFLGFSDRGSLPDYERMRALVTDKIISQPTEQ